LVFDLVWSSISFWSPQSLKTADNPQQTIQQQKNCSANLEKMENLEQAVNLFYKSQSNDQAQLNEFLTTQQRDSAAWTWLWSFLDLSKSVQF
jgi:dsDNA-specific endonuclease/ATPase MutS2